MVRQGARGYSEDQSSVAGYYGVNFLGDYDIGPHLKSGKESFQRALTNVFLKKYPDMDQQQADQALGDLWSTCEGMVDGDTILAVNPDHSRFEECEECSVGQEEMGKCSTYQKGLVAGAYEYHPGTALPHRRPVVWEGVIGVNLLASILDDFTRPGSGLSLQLAQHIENTAMSRVAEKAQKSMKPTASETQVGLSFQMERQLEEFLLYNWSNTSLGREYDIYEDNGLTGRQYQTDTGPMDILAISKDRTKFLVVELKRARASDVVVGQIQRYMGFVQEKLLEPGQSVEGVIVAREDDLRIQRALSMTRNIRFMKYRVEIHLESQPVGTSA